MPARKRCFQRLNLDGFPLMPRSQFNPFIQCDQPGGEWQHSKDRTCTGGKFCVHHEYLDVAPVVSEPEPVVVEKAPETSEGLSLQVELCLS